MRATDIFTIITYNSGFTGLPGGVSFVRVRRRTFTSANDLSHTSRHFSIHRGWIFENRPFQNGKYRRWQSALSKARLRDGSCERNIFSDGAARLRSEITDTIASTKGEVTLLARKASSYAAASSRESYVTARKTVSFRGVTTLDPLVDPFRETQTALPLDSLPYHRSQHPAM